MKLLKDKYEFILGFVAVIISLSAFKEELALIRIDLGLFQFSLANYFFCLIIGFVITLHIYIIPYLLILLGSSSLKFFSYLEKTASYLFAILVISTPILFSLKFILYIIKSFLLIDLKILNLIILVILILVILIIGIAASIIVKRFFKNKMDEGYDRFVTESVIRIEQAKKYYSEKLYLSAFMEAYAVIELYLRKELLKTGHMIKYSRDKNLYESARKSKILVRAIDEKIQEYMIMRKEIFRLDQSGDLSFSKSIIQFVEELFRNEK